MFGAELASFRRQVLAGAHDRHPAGARHKEEHKRLMGLTKDDMPPDTDDVWLLIETLSQRHGAIGHGKAWELIGITSRAGRDYLARNAGNVSWPVWFTLRFNALGR